MNRRRKLKLFPNPDWWRLCAIYSIGYCSDGLIVFFNREYEPIWVYDKKLGLHSPASCQYFRHNYEDFDPIRHRPDRSAVETYPVKQQAWLYTDINPPWFDRDTRARVIQVFADVYYRGKIPRYEAVVAMKCGVL